MRSLWIINKFDRPYERLVVVREGDKGRYSYADNDLVCYCFTNWEEATPLEDFGFFVKELYGGFYCIQVRESVATYNDGKLRRWQGASEFIVT